MTDRLPSPPHSTDGEKMTTGDSRSAALRTPYPPHTPPRSILPQDRDTTQYGDPSMYQIAPNYPFQASPQGQLRDVPYDRSSVAPDSGTQTRRGRSLGSPHDSTYTESTRRSHSPRNRRKKSTKRGKNGKPIIEEPLSVLTKDYQLPIRDMHAWVHRPLENRMKEVEDKKGYISRPMNSFMLYRSAYADRVKQFCKENNHQVVSQVTGASWPLEPREVRDMYEKLAMIERDNHQAAHPNYKFAPNKNGKKKQHVDVDASDDDPDWEGSTRTKRSRTASRRGETRSQSSTPFEGDHNQRTIVPQYPPVIYHPSSYQLLNPHGPAPMVVGPDGFSGQYYQQTVTPYSHQVDDVKFGRIENPFPTYDSRTSLVGLPNMTHHEILAAQPVVTQNAQAQGMLDPRLAQFDPSVPYVQYELADATGFVGPQHYEYGSYAVQPDLCFHQDANYHPGLATLTDGRDAWGEAEQAGAAFDEEFQKWG